ncbi:Dfp1/Him1, central region-domain-containing protein [Dipodascopsis tothii]|uniref:Dfp1/Him1, central region-domain-containing protein n=1 Tax=Dipodascopsis tothii TaxID=44089 RepID=UPI0034CF29B6
MRTRERRTAHAAPGPHSRRRTVSVAAAVTNAYARRELRDKEVREKEAPERRVRDRDDRSNDKESDREREEREREIDSIRSWQRQWRMVLETSLFYFDGIDEPLREKAKRCLLPFGAIVEPFFQGNLTHVITNRSLAVEYTSTDVIQQARQRKMKIWSYEKLVRFLSHLTEDPTVTVSATSSFAPLSAATHNENSNLSRLLLQEKIHGPADSDPRARRDDHHYFKGPYICIRDLSQHYRPIMMREYVRVSDPEMGDWPQFRLTGHGKSPFVHDTPLRPHHVSARDKTRSVKPQTQSRVADSKAKAASPLLTLKAVANETPSITLETTEEEYGDDTEIVDKGHGSDFRGKRADTLSDLRATSVRLNSHSDFASIPSPGCLAKKSARSFARSHCHSPEVIASGINRSMATSAIKSMTQSGGTANGLGTNISQAQSKEINNLKRKIFERKIRPLPVPNVAVRKEAVAVKEMRPGYCENCKDRFDDFEEHTKSRKHRKFALNDDNFVELDDLLVQLQRQPRHMT